MNTPVTRVALIGCGNISPAYGKGLRLFPFLELAACADLNVELARKRAAELSIPKWGTPEEILADPTIEVVINLTIPQAHAAVNKQILTAGKHAYCEKPFALNREEGLEVLALAAAKGLRVGCAPDTFLGASHQSCRNLLDDGVIGRPVSAFAAMACRGHESWHPNPEFYYQPGGGPLLDMGPYYLTALVNLFGPVKTVQANARTTFPERTITSEPKRGTQIKVNTPTHLTGLLEFHNGVVATTVFSFDVAGTHRLPMLEIFGETGNFSEPDPNHFDGAVELRLLGNAWGISTNRHRHEAMRGVGVADLVDALKTGRPHRASGALAYHVLDVMLSYFDSDRLGQRVTVASTCERPEALPVGAAAVTFS